MSEESKIELFIQFARKQLVKVSVGRNQSLKEVFEYLRANYELKQGNYQFILHGEILSDPNPFTRIKKHDKIILHYQPKQKQTTQEDRINEIIESLQNPPDEEQNRMLTDLYMRSINILNINHLYEQENNLWEPENSRLLQDLVNRMRENSALYRVLCSYLRPHSNSLVLIPGLSFDTPILLAGYRNRGQRGNTSTEDAIHEMMNSREREHFQMLVEHGINPTELCMALEQHNMNFQAAEESLNFESVIEVD